MRDGSVLRRRPESRGWDWRIMRRNPQLYVMSSDGGEPKRITFQGNYNQTPAFSPRGTHVAFTARDERNVFDIFLVGGRFVDLEEFLTGTFVAETKSTIVEAALVKDIGSRHVEDRLLCVCLNAEQQRKNKRENTEVNE